MKNKLLIAAFAMMAFPTIGFSQLDIVPWGGYNFGARVNVYGGEIKMKGAATYGINLDYNIDPETAIQFSYSNTQSTMTITDYYYPGGGSSNAYFSDVSENYFLLGGVRYFAQDKLQPYGSFNVGASYYSFTNIDDYYYQTSANWTRFAIGFGLGLKVMLSERIGIDMHIRALAPITWGGVGMTIGSGGAGAGAYVGSSFISGDVGGGLVIRLGE